MEIMLPKDKKGREAKYYIHRNLHKKAWSIIRRGRVICSVSSGHYLLVENPGFTVQNYGVKLYQNTKVRSVHAFISTIEKFTVYTADPRISRRGWVRCRYEINSGRFLTDINTAAALGPWRLALFTPSGQLYLKK